VEVDGVLDLGGEHVEVVEPLRVTTLVEIVAAQQMRALVHRRVEFELKAEGIGELQGAALKRLLRKRVTDAVFRKERRGLVEVLLVADFEAQAVAAGDVSLAQHQRVMLMLLAAAQVYRLVVAIFDMHSDVVFIKLAAGIQIDHVEHDMAGSDDVEGRIEDMLRDGHAVSSTGFRHSETRFLTSVMSCSWMLLRFQLVCLSLI